MGHSSGKAVTAGARDLGLSSSPCAAGTARPRPAGDEGRPCELTTQEREQLKRLRRQNAGQAKTRQRLAAVGPDRR